MLQIKKICTALFANLVFIANYSAAQEQNAQVEKIVPQPCQNLFSATEKMMNEAKNQPGTHAQINQIQNKLNQSKKQILEIDVAVQIKSCNQGLAKLSHLQKEAKELN